MLAARKISSLLWIGVITNIRVTLSSVSCPSSGVYDSVTSSCFWRVSSSLSASQSLSECQAQGGTLAVIPDMATQQFLQTHYSAVLESGSEMYVGYWIGVTDSKNEGEFRTYDGDLQTWTNWKSGDPNDSGTPSQDCVRMFPKENPNYAWQDRSCTESAPGICSLHISMTTLDPEGTTTFLDTTTETITTLSTKQTTTLTTTPESSTTRTSTPVSSATTPTTIPESSTLTSTTTPESSTSIPTTTPESSAATPESSTLSLIESTTMEGSTSFDSVSVTLVPGDETSDAFVGPTRENTESTQQTVLACSECSTDEPNTTCYCTCSPYLTMDDPVVKQKIQDLIETLTISKKNTSANRRKYISVPDDRPSARGIGYVGAAILVATVSSIVLLDLSTFIRHVKHLTLKATGREESSRVIWFVRPSSRVGHIKE